MKGVSLPEKRKNKSKSIKRDMSLPKKFKITKQVKGIT